ncbi:MAG: hypothetical protein KDA58_03725 [Planctomycetaceae bacterium]|nr:hypothetical protein [Planctomycetaceae bacterium]
MSLLEQTIVRLLSEIRETAGVFASLPADQWVTVLGRCCEATRDVRLFAAPPNAVDADLTTKIAVCFRTLLAKLEELDPDKISNSDTREVFSDYVENIRFRTELFEDLAAGKQPAQA